MFFTFLFTSWLLAVICENDYRKFSVQYGQFCVFAVCETFDSALGVHADVVVWGIGVLQIAGTWEKRNQILSNWT